MEISKNGLSLIASFEGFRENPYQDVVGVWTIGYGTTFYPSGKSVTHDDKPVTKEQAMGYVRWYVTRNILEHLPSFVKVPLTQNQIDALCSFIYNIGFGGFSKSTLLKLINNKADCKEIKPAFMLWVKAQKKVISALVKRRIKEADLFCSG